MVVCTAPVFYIFCLDGFCHHLLYAAFFEYFDESNGNLAYRGEDIVCGTDHVYKYPVSEPAVYNRRLAEAQDHCGAPCAKNPESSRTDHGRRLFCADPAAVRAGQYQ